METRQIYPWGKGKPTWTRDVAMNDSDKTFTVPTGKIWHILGIRVEYTATATVGNRNIRIVIRNTNNDVLEVFGKITGLAASQLAMLSFKFEGGYQNSGDNILHLMDLTSFASWNVSAFGDLPYLILPAAYNIRIYDVAAIDAAADDMWVVLEYIEYDA